MRQVACPLIPESTISEYHLFEDRKDIRWHEEVARGSWGQGGAREQPRKASEETEVETRRQLFGEPGVRLGSGRCVYKVRFQRDEAMGMEKGHRRDLSIR